MSPKIEIGEPSSKNAGCFWKISLHFRINNLISCSVKGTYVPDFFLKFKKIIFLYIFIYPFTDNSFSIIAST
jgi:hypothetical protein